LELELELELRRKKKRPREHSKGFWEFHNHVFVEIELLERDDLGDFVGQLCDLVV